MDSGLDSSVNPAFACSYCQRATANRILPVGAKESNVESLVAELERDG